VGGNIFGFPKYVCPTCYRIGNFALNAPFMGLEQMPGKERMVENDASIALFAEGVVVVLGSGCLLVWPLKALAPVFSRQAVP